MNQYKDNIDYLKNLNSIFKNFFDFFDFLKSKNLDSRADSLDRCELQEIQSFARHRGVSCEDIELKSPFDFYNKILLQKHFIEVCVEFINKKLL